MKTRRLGITLVETLVVIGIIGILLATLIPAVQNVRENARRTACQNNLRQIAMAIQNYESAHTSLPSLYNGTFLKQPRNAGDEFHFHSWPTAILPQLQQSDLCERIDLSLPEDPDGLLEITDGVTRATRLAKTAPGETVPVIVIGRYRRSRASSPCVRDRL